MIEGGHVLCALQHNRIGQGADGMLLLDKVFGKENGVYYTVSDRSNGG